MTTRSITIGPEKFTIFDSEISDSESEADEWVSVSTSTTISTTSTLPSHLNLNPKSAIKVRPPPPNAGVHQPYNSRVSSSPASSPPVSPPASALSSPPPPSPPPLPPTTIIAKTPLAVAKESPTPPSQPSKPANPTPTQPSTPHEPPTTLLKRFLPTLTAIYIVSPTSISPLTTHEHPNSNIRAPFSTLTSLYPNPPISTKATRSNANQVETYIRVCAACAKPPMTVYCDGTWTSPISFLSATTRQCCPIHIRAFHLNTTPNLPASRPSIYPLTCGKCTQMTDIINCPDCARKRDERLFQAVLDAVSPFNRIETETLGVGVFDMSVPVSGELYKHVGGCGCDRAR